MAKRNYRLQDIYDYLLEYYGLDWKMFMVSDFGLERGIRKYDFGGYSGKYKSKLSVDAIVYNGSKRQVLSLIVTNEDLSIGFGYKKPETSWSDYLALKHHEEQTL